MLRLVGKIGQVDLAKVFKNFVNVFFLIRNDRTLEKGGALHLNKFESPPLQGCIVPSLVEIDSVVLENKILKCHQINFTIS